MILQRFGEAQLIYYYIFVQDKSGTIEGDELTAFIKDLLEKNTRDVSIQITRESGTNHYFSGVGTSGRWGWGFDNFPDFPTGQPSSELGYNIRFVLPYAVLYRI